MDRVREIGAEYIVTKHGDVATAEEDQVDWMAFVWPVFGSAVGYHASIRRGFSRASGVISGAFWGFLAPLLYVFDWPYFAD
jgi:hypothetical protein